MDKSYQMIAKVYGAGIADTVKMCLEAAGIEVLVAQESAGRSIYPVTIGKMAQAKIFVRRDQAEEAKALLRDIDDGKFADTPEIEFDEPSEME